MKKQNQKKLQKKQKSLKLTSRKKLPKKKKTASSQLESELLESGFHRVVGIDEVGRGAWAGPVVVGAYIFTKKVSIRRGVNDSKQVTRQNRVTIAKKLTLDAHKIAEGSLELINTVGIGKTITKLIINLITELNDGHTFFLIDGRFGYNFGENTMQIIKGDSLHYSIAGASIIAKVYRDQLMQSLSGEYRGFGFEKNAGYPTPFHMAALKKMGPTQLHRKNFTPIHIMLEQISLL